MTRTLKKYMRNAAGLISLANGYWAFQVQSGTNDAEWAAILGAISASWVCYFCLVWLFEGLRSK